VNKKILTTCVLAALICLAVYFGAVFVGGDSSVAAAAAVVSALLMTLFSNSLFAAVPRLLALFVGLLILAVIASVDASQTIVILEPAFAAFILGEVLVICLAAAYVLKKEHNVAYWKVATLWLLEAFIIAVPIILHVHHLGVA
jgi:hypothetical protein